MRAGAGTRPSRRDMTVLTLPETKIPDELARTLTELPVPLAAVLRAAHAKVRAELTGERESTARYPTWRSLVLAANEGDLPVELPDRRVHELFEEQARSRPQAVAAVHGETQWTYAELNARANRLARALLARGSTREGVVGVVTERNLDWLASV